MNSDVGQALPPANLRQAAAPVPPFDRMAARYDELWTTTAIGRAQRHLVWRDIDALFHPGERILDIGCGTGEDAAHFTSRGLTVYATDASPAMVQVAQARGGFRAALCSAEELAQVGGTFDGAISNFGALNCVADLPAVAASLAGLVRPGGRVAICLLGRFCAWETFYYGVRGQFRKAIRRWRGKAELVGRTGCPPGLSARVPLDPLPATVPAGGGVGCAGPPCKFPVHYPSAAQFRAAFAPSFELQRWTGIGLCVPPSYVRLPATVVGVLAAFDRLFARLPLLRALADHRLFLLVRK
jgi:SAM-dependent methyltransferase